MAPVGSVAAFPYSVHQVMAMEGGGQGKAHDKMALVSTRSVDWARKQRGFQASQLEEIDRLHLSP